MFLLIKNDDHQANYCNYGQRERHQYFWLWNTFALVISEDIATFTYLDLQKAPVTRLIHFVTKSTVESSEIAFLHDGAIFEDDITGRVLIRACVEALEIEHKFAWLARYTFRCFFLTLQTLGVTILAIFVYFYQHIFQSIDWIVAAVFYTCLL